MHRIFTGRRLATVAVSSALTVCAFGGSAWAAPSGNGLAQHTVASDPTLATPQPASTADFSGNGANVHGPYDSTRNGDASANGNGAGPAYGKPCAGCVGKADNKNPKGQMPGGSDHNAGYECDRNAGIGRGNPAHTGCTTTSVTPVTPAVTPAVTPVVTPVTVSASTPAVVEAATVLGTHATSGASATAPAAPAVASVTVAKPAANVAASTVSGAKVPAAQVLGEHMTRAARTEVAAASASALPFTGAAHTQGMVLTALLLLSIGAGLLLGSRRRTTV